MSKPTTIASHSNSQGEKITIERVGTGEFAGHLVLVIHDDPVGGWTAAPMLLDEGTRLFLIEQCQELSI